MGGLSERDSDELGVGAREALPTSASCDFATQLHRIHLPGQPD